MRGYSAEERERFVKTLCELAQQWIVEHEAEFQLEIERGVAWSRNAATGDKVPRANPSLTVTLTINGGAHDTEGPPIVPSPPQLFRGPEG